MGNWLPPRQKLIIEDEEAPAADTSENPPPIPIQNPSDMSKVGKVDDGDNMSETFLHKLIADVDACVAKIAETEDGIQEAAKTFAEQLDESVRIKNVQIYSQKQNSLMRDIENELTALIKNRMSAQNTVVEFVRDKKDARKLNVGMTRELNVTFCERSAELLGAIEDGQEKKTIEMRQINGRLLRLAELRSKPKHVDMSACKLDSYLQKQYEQKRDKEYKSLYDRVISMIGEASCMKVDQGLNVSKSGQIEAELISENSSRELQHETTEFKQELQLVHSFEPTTFKERRSLSISTEVEQSQTGVQTNRLHLVDVGTEFGQDNQLTYELKEKVAMLKCEHDIARKQVNDIKMENDALTREMQENVNRMAQERAKKDVEKIKSLAEQVEILKQEFNTLRLENTHITTDMQEQITDIKKEKQELQERIIEAEEKVNTMVRLNDALELELQEKKSKKLMQVQIYSQQQNKWMANIEDGLTALLKSRMQEKNMEIEFVRCWNTSQIKPDGMLLTTCIHPSILGTDASNALSGVHVSPKVVLLVFHHKDEHALPIQTSDRILTEPSFRELSGILDIAFLSGKGIYDCNMNENSISQVMNFIERNIEGQ